MPLLAARAEEERNGEELLRIGGHVRAGLWLSLLLLTLTLLLFPTRLVLEYHPIQSISAIPNLPLFAALYAVWLLLLLLLLFSGRETPWWEKPALVGIFALVFIGFWLITGPYTGLRYDGLGNAAHVGYLSQQPDGEIPLGHPNLGYFTFPSMHLLTFALVQIAGLSLFQGVTFVLVFHLVLLAVLLYVLFLRGLNSPSLAALGTLLVIQGNIMLARYSFYPGVWALVFLVMFLLLLYRPGQALFDTWQERFLMLLLLGVTTITHAVAAVMLFFTLAGIYLVRNLYRMRAKASTGLVQGLTIAAFLVIPLSWDIYWASLLFESTTKLTAAVVKDFTESGALITLFNQGESYAGGAAPLWTVIIRYVWLATVFFLGVILGLRNLLNKDLSRTQQLESGGLVGLLMLSGTITLLSAGGAQSYRFLLYGAFFTVPIILRFLVGLPRNRRRLAVRLAISLFFVLSFPTFLAHNNLVGVSTYYPSELQASSFLAQNYGNNGRDLTVYGFNLASMLDGIPDANFRLLPEAIQLKSQEAFWTSADDFITAYESQGHRPGESVLFGFSKRAKALNEHLLGIRPEDPRWNQIADRLSYASDAIFDSGTVQLYTR